ncbi:MAG: hypothetical protein AAF492_24075 [Verrucomicrobiota bacterium]
MLALTPVLSPQAAGQAKVPTHKPHYRVENQTAEKDFLNLSTGRKLRREEIAVLSRLGREKKAERKNLLSQRQPSFGLEPDESVEYVAENKVVYRIRKSSETDKTDKPLGRSKRSTPQKKPVLTFSDDDRHKRFLSLAVSRKLVDEQIRGLDLILREKVLELKQVEKALLNRFAINPEKHYTYNAKERKIYEVISGKKWSGR